MNLLKNFVRYGALSVAGAILTPALAYIVREMSEADQNTLISSMLDAMHRYHARLNPEIANTLIIALRKAGFNAMGQSVEPEVTNRTPSRQEARARLLQYLKQDGDQCLCPNCLYAVAGGLKEVSSEPAPN